MSDINYGNAVPMRVSNFQLSTGYITGDKSPAVNMTNAVGAIVIAYGVRGGSTGIKWRPRWAIALAATPANVQVTIPGMRATSATHSTAVPNATWFTDTIYTSKTITATSAKNSYYLSHVGGTWLQLQAAASVAISNAKFSAFVIPILRET